MLPRRSLRRLLSTGHEVTLNGFGVMMCDASVNDPFHTLWVETAALLKSGCALELGAAFGAASLAALSGGAPCVVANDLEAGHLDALSLRFADSGAKGELHTLRGRVPDVLEEWWPPEPLHATLACNVLHFLTPDEVVDTARLLFERSAPGASLFVSLDSPHTEFYRRALPLYRFRKAVDRPNPGMHSVWPILQRLAPPRLRNIPVYHVMEPPALRSLLEAAHWTVVDCQLFPGDAAGNPEGVSLGGQEMVGAHAVKA